MRRRSTLAALVATGALVAACSSGGKSIDQAGQTTTTGTAAPTTQAGATTVPGTAAPTTEGPTTTAVPLDTLPDCPTDALASITSPVEITVWHGMRDVLNTEIDRLAAAYNASQSKVKVSLVAQGAYESVIDKYLQSGTGSLPDLAQMPEYMVQSIVDTDTVVPVGKCIEASGFDTSEFTPGALNAYATGGVQWGMPFNVSAPVLYYNKKVFVAAGLDPDKPPTSIAELRDYSQKIVASGAAKYGLVLDTSFDNGGGWFIEQWFAQAGQFYCNSDNGRSARATEVLFNKATGVDLLTELQGMVRDGLAVSVGDNASEIDDLLKLGDATEPAAMTIHTSAALAGVLNVLKGGQFPNLGVDDLGIGPMPGPTGAKGALVGGASLWIVDSGDPQRIAATWDFVQYLVGAQQQSEWASATGYVAVRSDALGLDPLKTTLATDPRFTVAGEAMLAAPDSPTSSGPIIGPLREVRGVMAQAVAAIYAGADVQKSLDDAKSQADGLISSYNALNS